MSEALGEQFDDLNRRRAAQQRRFFARKPKRIDNVLAQVVQRRGYAQVRETGEREAAWQSIADEFATSSRVGALRRGTLEILVANSLVMQELTFRKEELVEKLKTTLPDAGIKQLKFRIGQI